MKRLIVAILHGIIFLLLVSCAKEQSTIATSADGSKIKYSVTGNGEPVLFFVHGFSNNKSTWDQQVSKFSPKYKVVTIDLAGFGESENIRTNWTMANFGEDVLAVINKLHLKNVILIGHSLAGAVVIEASKISSDNIIGIVLVDVFKNIDAKYNDIHGISKNLMDILNTPSIEKIKPFFPNNPELCERYLLMIQDVPKIGWEESLEDFMRWSNEDLHESLKSLQVPLIAINSGNSPTNVDAYLQYIHSFKVKTIDGVGHYVFWQAPEKFSLLLDECIEEFTNN